LLYLNRAASGVTWQKVEQAMADIDAIEEKLTATAERVDDVEETVSNHQELIESLVQRLETTDGSSGYMSHGEFETELYESPDYIPQRYREINHEESDPFGLSDPEPIEGEDAQTRLLEIINEDQSSVTTVVGES